MKYSRLLGHRFAQVKLTLAADLDAVSRHPGGIREMGRGLAYI